MEDVILKEVGVRLYYFDEFFQMRRHGEKEIEEIIRYYQILPKELFVIGDNLKREIIPARRLGCRVLLVPEYRMESGGDFDFSKIVF